MIERFTRDGPDRLGYEFTVNDPNTWTRPWSGSLPMTRTEGPMFEFACHEGNHGLLNILAGVRAQDRAEEARWLMSLISSVATLPENRPGRHGYRQRLEFAGGDRIARFPATSG